MKFAKPQRFQVIGFWLSMPFITFALSYILYEDRIFHDWKPWLATYPLIYLIGYFSWRSHVSYDHYFQGKFPGLDHTNKRVLYKSLVNFIVMTPSILLIFFVYDWFHILGYSIGENDLKYGYLVGLSVNIIFQTLWEVVYILDKYKETAAEKEMIDQMQLQQEFDNLKQKVNPHFLFNCFNTLSSLITEDKEQAEKFLDELSKVYRYLLRNNESGMSTVEQELNFIKSYFKLIKTRHGQGVELAVDVNAAYKEYVLPSLSLQLLVENAVKHNIISKQDPIQINISTNGKGYLTVENNLNKKLSKGESTGIGLANIREKYKLLNRNDVVVKEEKDKFVVSLPLIA
ncbi:MAG: histidine kinase [Fimbriimonadaceae bacterium]|nr:histidine kinase [Chitinophagales bacterium]